MHNTFIRQCLGGMLRKVFILFIWAQDRYGDRKKLQNSKELHKSQQSKIEQSLSM